MAEFLIYKGPHQWDKLTNKQVQELGVLEKARYACRYQPGDYTECQEDGKWPDKAAAAGIFYYLRVLGVKAEDLNYLTKTTRRPHNTEEEIYHSREVDNEIVEIGTDKTVDELIGIKIELMMGRLDKKPLAFKRRYALDLTKLTPEEMKSFDDGKFLVLSESRHTELIKDKLA